MLLIIVVCFILQVAQNVLCQCPFQLTTEKPLQPKTDIQDAISCPIPPPTCDKTAYRSLDGTCNNLENPGLGMPFTPYRRLIPSNYHDNIHKPRKGITGNELPNARQLSLGIFGEKNVPDPSFNLLNMQWGQVLAHDIGFTAGVTQTRKHSITCCSPNGTTISPHYDTRHCFAIRVSPFDPVYSKNKPPIQCLEFVRTLTDKDINCNYEKGEPTEQINSVTSYIDASILYGNSAEQNIEIRSFEGGKLWSKIVNGEQFLPPSDNATVFCGDANAICYKGGDVRVNQSPGLISLQTLLLREHNRIADELAIFNPTWCDEKLFQEARKIFIAIYQHINYYEFLPISFGRENMIRQKIIYELTKDDGDYVNDYNSSVNPSAINSFSTAAFRLFHSAIEGYLKLIDERRYVNDTLRLSDYFNRPGVIESGDNLDAIIRGHTTQSEEKNDINIDREVKHFLSKGNNKFGSDLKARDIQRNRDHGLPSYNDFREFVGLTKAKDWTDFADVISLENIQNLLQYYSSVDDVDLTVGAALEDGINNSMVGPTFFAISMEQFFASRVGDRFFYENEDVGFAKDQINEIRKATMARLICDNALGILTIQQEAFRKVSKNNPLKKCEDIPKPNLQYWKDDEEDLCSDSN